MTTTTTATAAPPATQSRQRSAVADIASVWLRETLTIWRDPFSLAFSLVQPLIFLGLFAPLLDGMATGMTGAGGSPLSIGDTLQWFLPGVVVMIAAFGTSMTGSNL